MLVYLLYIKLQIDKNVCKQYTGNDLRKFNLDCRIIVYIALYVNIITSMTINSDECLILML